MRAIKSINGKCTLVTDAPIPQPTATQVLIKVHATSVNRADTLQASGKYPPPPGCTDILGLECAGEIAEVGESCSGRFKKGDKVIALLPGGGYADFAAADECCVMPMPQGMSFAQAAAIPEVWLTAFQLLTFVAKVEKSDSVLVHAAGSGVGTAALQIIRAIGATSLATAGSDRKLAKAKELGAAYTFNRRENGGNWDEGVLEATNKAGVSVLLDCIGYPYVKMNSNVIGRDGRWVLYGLMGGPAEGGGFELSLRTVLVKRVQLLGTTLRARALDYKRKLVLSFSEFALKRFASGEFVPILDEKSFGLEDAQLAHEYMLQNTSLGKIILFVQGSRM